MRITFRATGLLLATAFAIACGGAVAQNFPNKPIKLVVGVAPGGGTDILGRLVGQQLSERLGVPVLIENKPGANGNIGNEYVANAAADGYTLLVGGSATMVLSAGLYKRLPFDLLRDFSPIALITPGTTLVFAVHPSVPANSIRELIDLAKSKPGELFYASGAAVFQVAAELFNKRAGVSVVQVPFKGAAPAIAATVGGQTAVIVVSVASGLPQIRGGRLRPLAVTGSHRDLLLPNVPTMNEAAGLENFEVPMWTGLFAPGATPGPVVDKLANEMSAILKSDIVKKRLNSIGYEVGTLTHAEFTNLQRDQIEYWSRVIREDLRIRLE